jgi:hypothetical protein
MHHKKFFPKCVTKKKWSFPSHENVPVKNLRNFKTKNEKFPRNLKPQLHMVRENDPKKNFPRFTVYVIFYLFIFFQLNRVNKMCVIQIISFFSRNNFDFFI